MIEMWASIMQDLITKFTAEATRKDGSQVRIVATEMGMPFCSSIDVYVHARANSQTDWQLCSDKPHPDWKIMPVDDYIKFGRSEVLKAVSPGEILKVVGMIGKPLSKKNEFCW